MITNPLLSLLIILVSLGIIGCQEGINPNKPEWDIPIRNHDLSYTPFNPTLDHPDFIICDSTKIKSGRNQILYRGGLEQLHQDLRSAYKLESAYRSFTGYVVVRFIMNCNSELGRYRAESLHLDFSSAQAPPNFVNHILDIFKNSNHWDRRLNTPSEQEYSKFINIKFKDGQIQHVLR